LLASFFNLAKIRRKEIGFGVAGLFFIVLLVAYLTKSFVRDRYAAFVFFLACLLWGWGIVYSLEPKFKAKNIATLFILPIFVVNIALYCVRGKTLDRQVEKLNNELANETGVKTGFLIENPTLAYIYVREYGLGDRLIPINAYNPDMFKKEKIDAEFLLSEGSVLDLSNEELAENLKIGEVEQYFYLMSIRSEETGYDPERRIFSVLSKNCSEEIVMFPDNVTILYKFDQCNFD
jgi:hypothetical protein